MRSTVAQMLSNWASWYDELGLGVRWLEDAGFEQPAPEVLTGSGPGAPSIGRLRQGSHEQRVERTELRIGFLQLDNQSLYASVPVVLAPATIETEVIEEKMTLFFELERCPDLGLA